MSRTPGDPLRRSSGFSLIDVMITCTVMVVGLFAVTSSTVSAGLLRKRDVEDDVVFGALLSRVETIRSELFTDSDLQDDVAAQLAVDGTYEGSFAVDQDGDGTQDVSFAAGDQVTPVISVTITVPDPPGNANTALQVQATANWYGVGGGRTRTISTLVANRSGFGG